MGMAASQARYLELTARKTNVEYEGQQINQQRTSLANESAGLFSQLMGLAVPTPPSTTNYTTTSYMFNDGSDNCTISRIQDLQGNPNYNATVSYSYNRSVYTGVSKSRSDLGMVYTPNPAPATDGVYWLTAGTPVGIQKLTQCGSDDNIESDKAALDQIVKDTGSTNLATDYDNGDGIDKIYKYSSNGSTYYYSKTDLDHVIHDYPNGVKAPTTDYYAAYIDKKQSVTENAYVTKEDSGRYATIKLQSESATLNLTATTTTDQNAYNDAVNEYEYQQELYQQHVNNLNSKTSIIQAEDRTLELKLRQLDTEQQALSNEMEAIKKVIDKNIQDTFKTFGN